MTIRYEDDYAHVETYEFWSFIKEIAEVVAQGYALDLSNERFPTQYVGYWSAYFTKTAGVVYTDIISDGGRDPRDEIPAAIPDLGDLAEEHPIGRLPTTTSVTPTVENEAPRRGRPPRNR